MPFLGASPSCPRLPPHKLLEGQQQSGCSWVPVVAPSLRPHASASLWRLAGSPSCDGQRNKESLPTSQGAHAAQRPNCGRLQCMLGPAHTGHRPTHAPLHRRGGQLHHPQHGARADSQEHTTTSCSHSHSCRWRLLVHTSPGMGECRLLQCVWFTTTCCHTVSCPYYLTLAPVPTQTHLARSTDIQGTRTTRSQPTLPHKIQGRQAHGASPWWRLVLNWMQPGKRPLTADCARYSCKGE